MNAASIRRRALSGQLEVEHLLLAAGARSIAVADEIERLGVQQKWLAYDEVVVDGARYVPLATWALVVTSYIRYGHRGLLELADRTSALTPFVLALLETLHDPEALASAIRLSHPSFNDPTGNRVLSFELASTFNVLLSFPPTIEPTEAVARQVRQFLHTLVAVADTDVQLSTALLALRGVGDESSLELIKATRALPSPWDTSAALTTRAIRRRLRQLAQNQKTLPERS